jgi:single-strand DNA-binding protein
MLNGTQITIVGNIGADPDMRYTPTGQAVASFSVGSQNRRIKRGNEWEDTGTTWYRVITWRDLAENVAQSLKRGIRVIVVGTLVSRDWEDKDGNKRTSWEITADACGPDLSFTNVAVAPRAKRARASAGPGDVWGNGAEETGTADINSGDSDEPPF